MPPVLCSFDAIEASPIRPLLRSFDRARRTRAQPAALRRSHRLRVAHAPSLARTMSAATSHHASALAGARNLASSRSVRGAAIRATARVARSAPRGASLRVNAERATPPPLFRPAPPRPRDIRRVASAPPRVTARERASRGVCHRNRPGPPPADPTPRRDRADRPPSPRTRRAPARSSDDADPRAGTRARSPTRRLASARDHRGGPSRASAPRDDDVVAPYPQLDREPGGFVTRRVSDALSGFEGEEKEGRISTRRSGSSLSNALAPTGRRVRRGRAIIRAPIILTDPPPPSSPRGGFVVSPPSSSWRAASEKNLEVMRSFPSNTPRVPGRTSAWTSR